MSTSGGKKLKMKTRKMSLSTLFPSKTSKGAEPVTLTNLEAIGGQSLNDLDSVTIRPILRSTERPLSKSLNDRTRSQIESESLPHRPWTILGEDKCRQVPNFIRKIGITDDNGQKILYEFNQNQPLAAIIKEIAEQWNLDHPEDYALQFSETSRQTYITERNRGSIQNGNVLQLTDSPARAASNIIEKLKTGKQEEKLDALKNLDIKSSDPTFALEFIHKTGLKLIIDSVMAGSKNLARVMRYYCSGDPLMYMLRSFVSLMEHGVVSWDILEPEFTKQIAEFVSGARPTTEGCIRPCLEILENLILHSTDISRLSSIEHNIPPEKVGQYLEKPNTEIQQSALAVINAMFTKSSPDQQKNLTNYFQTKHFRSTIIPNILGKPDTHGSEMTHQLYKLQKLMLNMYEERKNTKLNTNDAAQVAQVNKCIEVLRRIGFDFSDAPDTSNVPNRKSAVSKDFKKLGFLNQTNPMLDFEETPPGLLALDNMVYFAETHKESYIKVVLENCGRANEQDCPFVQASIHLTKILCDLLKIGEDPYDDEHSYYPMFFTVDRPLEEFYTNCIQLYNRTWREMRASKEDQSKVLSVVNEQITRALKSQVPATFKDFKKSLDRFQYPELKKIWEAERQKKDESKAQAKPILELREMITPEILDLIKRQRLRFMEGGSRFLKFDKGKKGRYWYWRLAPNHKSLHYDDCGDQETPNIESLANKISILDIKDLLIGRNCPHLKSNKTKTQVELAFCLMLEGSKPEDETYFHFIANSEKEFHIWVDGLSVLLNNKMNSKLMREDMDTLLNMEIKLRLLETEGIPIPKEPPPIPPLPDNYNFAYTMS